MAVDDMIGDSFQGLTDHIFDEVRSISLGLKKPCAVPAITTTAVTALSGDRLHRESRNDNTPTRNLLRPSLPTTSSDVIDAACWATLMDWLVPPPPSFSSQHASERKKRPPAQQAFFLPCSDQDVRLLAEKKSAILAHCSAMAKSRYAAQQGVSGVFPHPLPLIGSRHRLSKTTNCGHQRYGLLCGA